MHQNASRLRFNSWPNALPGGEMSGEAKRNERLDAWYDGSAICVIAVGSQGDPLDLGEKEVAAFIEKLQKCLKEAQQN